MERKEKWKTKEKRRKEKSGNKCIVGHLLRKKNIISKPGKPRLYN